MRFNEKATIEGFSVQRKIKPIHLTFFTVETHVNIFINQLDSLLKKERSIKPILTLYSENDASDSINTINFLTVKTHLSNMRTTNATA